MGYRQFEFGVLNPVTHPQSGRTLDPSSQSGFGSISEAAKKSNRPNFLEKLGFPLKGVVLKIEEEQSSEGGSIGEGFLSWIFGSEADEINPVRVRIRVPEIHSHLPIPETFGPKGSKSIMALYPIFTGKDTNTPVPSVGEVVYVDFGDRVRFEDPIYLGPVKEGRPVGEGAESSTNGITAQEATTENTSTLNSSAPPGDSVGQGGELNTGAQIPVSLPPVPKPNEITCKNTRNPTANSPPSCAPFSQAVPGLYRSTAPRPGRPRGDFIELGLKEMDVWENRRASNRLVLASIKHTLILMEQAFIKETKIKDIDVKKFINDGYRSFEKQACFRAKYDACVKEWKRRGGKFPNRRTGDPGANLEQRPTGVGKPGPGKHSQGIAVDFNSDGTGRGRKNRTRRLWTWLARNSTRFGWRWAGKNFNPQEPWHYEFDEQLARSLGLFPRPNEAQARQAV